MYETPIEDTMLSSIIIKNMTHRMQGTMSVSNKQHTESTSETPFTARGTQGAHRRAGNHGETSSLAAHARNQPLRDEHNILLTPARSEESDVNTVWAELRFASTSPSHLAPASQFSSSSSSPTFFTSNYPSTAPCVCFLIFFSLSSRLPSSQISSSSPPSLFPFS